MKNREKPDTFLLPHGMPSNDGGFAFSSRVFPKASKIKPPYNNTFAKTGDEAERLNPV
jgi:hypothetical protein